MTKRKKERYRQHDLLAAFHGGRYQGRAWKGKALVIESDGTSIDEVLPALRVQVDERFNERAGERGDAAPSVEEYTEALLVVQGNLNKNQLAMLRAHYEAPERTVTSHELAAAAGYASHTAANLHYGRMAALLRDEMCFEVPAREDGSPIVTCVVATSPDREAAAGGDDKAAESEWRWVMRPEMAEAISRAGLF